MPGRKKKHYKNNFREAARKGATTYSLIHGPDGDEAEAADTSANLEQKESDAQLYGIFYEDGYDYFQHLKDVSEFRKSKMEKASMTLRPDEIELEEEMEEVYKLDQASCIDFSKADDPQLDPEIKTILENDCLGNLDEELEDNFMELADPFHEGPKTVDLSHHLQEVVHIGPKTVGEAEDFHIDSDSAEFDEEDDDDDEWEDDDDNFDSNEEDKKDVMENARSPNNLLKQLDKQTRELFQREFGEDQIGALELDEPRGRCGVDSELMKQVFNNNKDKNKIFSAEELFADKLKPNLPESWKFVEEVGEEEAKERDDKIHRRAWSPKRPQWDCETILSTLSTTKNLPKTISWPSSGEKNHKPKEKELPGLSLKEIEEMRRAEKTADAPPSFRPAGETPEERRERKKAVKQHRKERREEKKANKMAFRTELLAKS